MYCIRTSKNSETIKKAKGVKKCVLDKQITFEHYKKCLENMSKDSVVVEPQITMRSLKHNVFNITTNKKVLDPFDDKRYLMPNSHSTLAWGHYKIR